MAHLIWTATAVDDLHEIASVIALDKPDAATSFAAKAVIAIERLADFPMSGRIVPEARSPRYRELIVPPARIIYAPGKDSVTILRIIRSERQVLPEMFEENP